MSRLFGTDGVRGVANAELTPELCFRIGRAGATVLSENAGPLVVGRDTRLSGTMLEAAIVAGITSVGRDAVLLGVLPTPGVACVTRREGAAAGIVISASHNPIADNGVKFFGPDGFKLSDEIEDRIEALLDATDLPRPTGTGVGIARTAQNLGRYYYEELYSSGANLHGLHVVVDGAFGAAYAVAPYALRKLGADVSEINCENDGSRINVGCGATDLGPLRAAVREAIASGRTGTIGVAFDGDADRALFIDETGAPISGDHVMFAIARDMQSRRELAGDAVVGTVMSNIGFERALRVHGIGLIRASVGDRYVLERMQSGGYVLGGEQSGHVIDFRRNTTGDGPMTAVSLLGIVAAAGVRLHDLVSDVVIAPQVLVNVRTPRKDVLDLPEIQAATAAAQRSLGDGGRLLIRPSGTEPLIRVMAEGEDRGQVEQVAAHLASRIEEEIGRLTQT
ncbi:MAG: phosphoglucosamine mutase [Candidatus Eremiobacteraeota bacterium]|nr:phosphoglucosamine mutase [Candidatus Eremiobacteraeota bacterium]MBV8720965.1 phosphoglucosamine mutase [Candidatus Eremiobacteraeota bacterium]